MYPTRRAAPHVILAAASIDKMPARSRRLGFSASALPAACLLTAMLGSIPVLAAQLPRVALPTSHIPPGLVAYNAIRATAARQPVTLDLVLRLRNPDAADAMIARISSPHDPLYGHYLTPEQFRDQYAATDDQVQTVEQFAARHGLSVGHVSSSNLYVQVNGTAAQVDETFDVALKDYRDATGRVFHSPDSDPAVDSDVAPLICGVVGLSNEGVARSQAHLAPQFGRAAAGVNGAKPLVPYFYHGTYGLIPADTSSVYSMTNAIGSGIYAKGQVMGLFELGSFYQSDAAEFYSDVDWPTVTTTLAPVTPVSVDGYNVNSTPPGDDSIEVILDIDLFETWAYGANQIRVYEATDNPYASFPQEVVDSFDAMANEPAANRPNVISVSYGEPEIDLAESDVQSEAEVLSQLALQGQTVCVASGDSGAWDDQTTTTPNVDDPGVQPLVTCVGGTELTDGENAITGAETLISETSWFDPRDYYEGNLGTGGGGGMSAYWPMPYYQANSFSTSVNPQGSTTYRNTPDVSLYGDFDTGYYEFYCTSLGIGGDSAANGTSASSPLWAALLADVNQERHANNLPNIGFANPSVYTLAENAASYATDFYDVNDGSTNGVYQTVNGYDNSTGWGTIRNGTQLVADLAQEPITTDFAVSVAPGAVQGGVSATGTLHHLIYQSDVADTFTLSSSNPAVAAVPGTAAIAKGSMTGTFTVTTKSVATPTTVTITATYAGYSSTTTITVNPPAGIPVSSVTLNPNKVLGGHSSTATVTLSAAAPAGGQLVTLSSNGTAATVPATVTVLAGAKTAKFQISSSGVQATTDVTISAGTAGSTAQSAILDVTFAIFRVSFSPDNVTGGHSTTGTVTISAPAPADLTIDFKSSDSAIAPVPKPIVIPAGATQGTFKIITKTVTTATVSTIEAYANNAGHIDEDLTVSP